jgi:hypothetical protein
MVFLSARTFILTRSSDCERFSSVDRVPIDANTTPVGGFVIAEPSICGGAL